MTRQPRILIVGALGAGQLAQTYAGAMARLCVDVRTFDSDRAYFGAGRWSHVRLVRRALRSLYWRRVNEGVLAAARATRPAAVFAVKTAFMERTTVRALQRELGVPVVNYYPDNPYCGVPWNPRKTSAQRRDLLSVLLQYDRVWIWEPGMARRLADDGIKAEYLPFAVDDAIFRAQSAGSRQCAECGHVHPVVFIGQHSDKRGAHIRALQQHAVGLWGSRWNREAGRFSAAHIIHKQAAFGGACASIYHKADIALNIVDDLNMPGHNMRTFEIPGSGGVMLAAYTREQDAIFPEGVAAEYYRDPAEIDRIVGRLLSAPEHLQRLRAHAVSIAMKNTYLDRSRTILQAVGIEA